MAAIVITLSCCCCLWHKQAPTILECKTKANQTRGEGTNEIPWVMPHPAINRFYIPGILRSSYDYSCQRKTRQTNKTRCPIYIQAPPPICASRRFRFWVPGDNQHEPATMTKADLLPPRGLMIYQVYLKETDNSSTSTRHI